MAVVYSKVLLFDPPLIYTAPDTCVFGAVYCHFRGEILDYDNKEKNGEKHILFIFSAPEIVFSFFFVC